MKTKGLYTVQFARIGQSMQESIQLPKHMTIREAFKNSSFYIAENETVLDTYGVQCDIDGKIKNGYTYCLAQKCFFGGGPTNKSQSKMVTGIKWLVCWDDGYDPWEEFSTQAQALSKAEKLIDDGIDVDDITIYQTSKKFKLNTKVSLKQV